MQSCLLLCLQTSVFCSNIVNRTICVRCVCATIFRLSGIYNCKYTVHIQSNICQASWVHKSWVLGYFWQQTNRVKKLQPGRLMLHHLCLNVSSSAVKDKCLVITVVAVQRDSQFQTTLFTLLQDINYLASLLSPFLSVDNSHISFTSSHWVGKHKANVNWT